ncbi:lysocardiolipin acyltransferase 1 isoform X1 [Neophocaena asiaeorientalis asiaeorientalis]|uniref:Lysocardiolipin acyltransferase 1 isoform X1 n=1 Tax=Neophocaena asiaeorientalis asiaeorientalis TaxID=1706337 RepID=A0A341ADU7_NEOAA|nr:lysocardiolipin acyltransferase 1 isoform X1 [Neophocaena asiaeorientalis asiaeorientalis]XP_024587293.1 lysocardiolipin acyltransferase 1 isoform X1 [Neophocaena asiaeorientalis asiaeorientalis]XP_024587294.1 lysocardiolipin acyltransferase 1 isoform X1 [Neophocaena asiaeorientalis asiaeorientalis]
MVSWRGIYFILTLFWGSFFGSIFMLGPFLPLMFINPSWYRWINNRLVATWLTLPVALLETVFGVKVIITGDAFVPGERSVIIMNHRTRMDWMFLWNCLMRYSYLRLEKICLKATLKCVPGFGWAMQAAAYIFIHRKWKDDKSHFEDMIDYFCDIHEPLQLLIFPEGTDLTENSTARSNEFAEKNGLQKYEYVLHPRTTGFTFVVDRLREDLKWPLAEDKIRKTWLAVSKPGKNLDAVHDITVAYPHNIPQTERHLLLGDFPKEIHFHVHRYPVDTLPTSKEDLQLWCRKRWEEKEERLRSFYQGEKNFYFTGQTVIPPCKSELRVLVVKLLSLLYWTLFGPAVCLLVCLYSLVRWYFIIIIVVFVVQERIFGGLEIIELACYRFLHKQPHLNAEKKE